MPFKSKAQQKWMFATHPDMAKGWAAETPNIKKLPTRVKSGVPKIRVKLPKAKY